MSQVTIHYSQFRAKLPSYHVVLRTVAEMALGGTLSASTGMSGLNKSALVALNGGNFFSCESLDP